jgi:tellurite methyltransferase
MSHPDAERWNRRYQEEERYAAFSSPRPFLVQNESFLPAPGLALEAAMGLGGNAGFLLERGWRVIGVDISGEAVRQVKARLPSIWAVQADLAHFPLPPERFDLILNFYFLERSLWPAYTRALRPGGILILETLTEEMQAQQPEIPPEYLLRRGELEHAFPGLETLHLAEGWHPGRSGKLRPTGQIIARKPY